MDDAIAGGSSSEFLMGEPADQILERQQEKENVFKAYPVLVGLLDYLRSRIAFYKSVDAIDPSLLTDPDLFMHTVAGNKLAADALESELHILEGKIDEHLHPQL